MPLPPPVLVPAVAEALAMLQRVKIGVGKPATDRGARGSGLVRSEKHTGGWRQRADAHLLTMAALLMPTAGLVPTVAQLPPHPQVCTMRGPSTNAVRLGLSCALHGKERRGQGTGVRCQTSAGTLVAGCFRRFAAQATLHS